MKKFINDESGATAIEYGLIAAAMGLMLVIAMPFLATAVSGVFGRLASGLDKADLNKHSQAVLGSLGNMSLTLNHRLVPVVLFLCNDLTRLTLSLRRACDDCTARIIPTARQHLGNS